MNKIIYTQSAWDEFHRLINKYNTEVAWHGVGSKNEEGDFIITDILVYPQKVTGATVEMDNEGYQKWLWENRFDERFYKIILQGHSHVHMPVFPSSTDIEHQNKIYNEMKKGNSYIFTIWNKHGDHKAWICTKE